MRIPALRLAFAIGLLVALLAPTGQQAPVADAASPGGSITWTVDHVKKTIEVMVRIQIYPGCSGNPYGDPKEQAHACDLPRSMLGGATQLMADKIKAGIERIWNKPYKFRCYTLHFQVDVKLGMDGDHLDQDRIGVRIDPSPVSIRSFVHTSDHEPDKWQSDDPADKLTPDNGGDHVTTWSERSTRQTFAHEFGHLLGLHDAYEDVPSEFVPGEIVSEPRAGAPIDLMSTGYSTSISQETIDRVVKRNIPVMKDTQGKSVRDEDLNCDWQATLTGKKIGGTLRWCGQTEHPYWGLDVVTNAGDRAFVAYDIPIGSEQIVQGTFVTPFVSPEWKPYAEGTGSFVPGDPPHFVLDLGDGTYILTLERGSFCTYAPRALVELPRT